MFNIFKKKTISLIILIITSIIISLFIFWRTFIHTYKIDKKSMQYEETQKKLNFEKPRNSSKKEIFIVEKYNIQNTLKAMVLAKKYILNNNLEKSYEQLKNCLKYTEEENLRNILKLRMVKIKIQKNEYATAIKILEEIKNKSWINIIENIKGDIFFKQNKKKEAVNAWKKSLSKEFSNASKEIIKMKINEII